MINVDNIHTQLGSVALWRRSAAALKTLAHDLFGDDASEALHVVKARAGARTSLELTPEACTEASAYLQGLADTGQDLPSIPRLALLKDGPFDSSSDAVSWAMGQAPCPFGHGKHARNSLVKLARETGLTGASLGWAWVEKVGVKQQALLKPQSAQQLGEEIRERLAA